MEHRVNCELSDSHERKSFANPVFSSQMFCIDCQYCFYDITVIEAMTHKIRQTKVRAPKSKDDHQSIKSKELDLEHRVNCELSDSHERRSADSFVFSLQMLFVLIPSIALRYSRYRSNNT